jgi:D-alanyl-D-alanine carboxypeptidase/D-alanyl-D-alanine-endopeptidase (penicillin-binding protein 4)
MLMSMRVAPILAVLMTCAAPALSVPGAPPPVVSIINAEHLPESSVSFAIIDPDGGKLVAGQNVDIPRSPASTIKLVTTFAALDLLGPAYVWHTRAWLRGTLKEGELDGDLVLQGGGDPYMTLERWWSFAQELRNRGLKVIRGDIIIDETAFSLPAEDPAAFDGRPNRAYNVVPDALMVNFQSVEFRLVPNAGLHRIDIIAIPQPVNLHIDNQIAYVPGRCNAAADRVDFEVQSDRWDRVVFSGALSPNCEARSIVRVLLRPADYAFGTFAALWREVGGEFDGKLRIEPKPADAREFLNFDSLTLGEIVRLTNKFSSNLMARHLLLAIGESRFGLPATPAKGAAAIADWSQERGLDLHGIEIDNGSGLSRATHISVLQMAQLLSAAYHSRYAPEFMASLPLAGVDGTLRSRMKNTAAGTVRLKTGHIDGVSGVAGYVTTPKGKTFVLVSLINDPKADGGGGEPVHAALVTWIQDNL